MNIERAFEIKCSVFCASGLALALLLSTFIDGRLVTHVLWGARSYPLGYWIVGLGPIVFVGMFLGHRLQKTRWQKIVIPALVLPVVGFVSLFNFFPEWPHINVGGWTLAYFLSGICASWVHYHRLRDDFANASTISEGARIERAKEGVSTWRMLAVTLTGGYIALLIPWFGYFLTSTVKMVSDPGEALMLRLAICGEITFFSIWMLLGPLYEVWLKVGQAMDVLLMIGEGGRSAVTNS